MNLFLKIFFSVFLLLISPFSYAQTELWGLASAGGKYGGGVIFKLDSNGHHQVITHHFMKHTGATPTHNTMCVLSDGSVLGTTQEGGKSDGGVFFKYNPTSGIYSKIFDFDETVIGTKPSGKLTQGSNGRIYGVTTWAGPKGIGGIYEFDPVLDKVKLLTAFDPAVFGICYGGVTEEKPGVFYGIANRGGSSDKGVIYKYSLAENALLKICDLNDVTGNSPYGGFIKSLNGKLYALMLQGGNFSRGTILQYDPALVVSPSQENPKEDPLIKNPEVRYAFGGSGDGSSPAGEMLEFSEGIFYGTTSMGGQYNRGQLFEFKVATNSYTKKMDFDWGLTGSRPTSTLLKSSDSKIYGTTAEGGNIGIGIVYSFNPQNAEFSKLVDFGDTTDQNYWGHNGGSCYSGVVEGKDGKIYGVTSSGGNGSRGVLFQYDPATKRFTKKIDFNGMPYGGAPFGDLFPASDGKLYGMAHGGEWNSGVLFSIDPLNNEYRKEFDFEYHKLGGEPIPYMVEALPGKLVFLSTGGGGNNGAILQFDLQSKKIEILKEYKGPEIGFFGVSGLIKGSDGLLYGAFSSGGTNGWGSFYSFDYATKELHRIYEFDGELSGGGPSGPLIQLGQKIYGTCNIGGANQNGIFFSYDIPSKIYSKVFDFDANRTGSVPEGKLTVTRNNTIIGVTKRGGTEGMGVIYEYNPVTNSFEKLLDFYNFYYAGGAPSAPLLAANGKYYGMTNDYGFNNNRMGLVYEFDIEEKMLKKKLELNDSTGGFPFLGSFIEISAQEITSNRYDETKEEHRSLAIYPNPCNDVVHITAAAKVISAKIKNVYGVSVKDILSISHTQSINVSMLQQGYYLLEIATSEGIQTFSFIKQ